jgi:hypothetical protein
MHQCPPHHTFILHPYTPRNDTRQLVCSAPTTARDGIPALCVRYGDPGHTEGHPIELSERTVAQDIVYTSVSDSKV